jgi:hypothetical protein
MENLFCLTPHERLVHTDRQECLSYLKCLMKAASII